MRQPRWCALGVSLLSFCHFGTRPASLGAEAPTPACLSVDVGCPVLPALCAHVVQATGETLGTLEALPLESGAWVPPEDPRASTCRYLGFQAEWLASKRDAGLVLETVFHAAQRIFARDHPWDAALAATLGPLIYRAPQRSPAELRQILEAACLAPPGLWTDPDAAWTIVESH